MESQVLPRCAGKSDKPESMEALLIRTASKARLSRLLAPDRGSGSSRSTSDFWRKPTYKNQFDTAETVSLLELIKVFSGRNPDIGAAADGAAW